MIVIVSLLKVHIELAKRRREPEGYRCNPVAIPSLAGRRPCYRVQLPPRRP